jgi:hypothetical protein
LLSTMALVVLLAGGVALALNQINCGRYEPAQPGRGG